MAKGDRRRPGRREVGGEISGFGSTAVTDLPITGRPDPESTPRVQYPWVRDVRFTSRSVPVPSQSWSSPGPVSPTRVSRRPTTTKRSQFPEEPLTRGVSRLRPSGETSPRSGQSTSLTGSDEEGRGRTVTGGRQRRKTGETRGVGRGSPDVGPSGIVSGEQGEVLRIRRCRHPAVPSHPLLSSSTGRDTVDTHG